MADIRDLCKDSAELSDLVGILQGLVDRIEALEAQQKAAFKLGRNAGLEEAEQFSKTTIRICFGARKQPVTPNL